MNECIDKSSGFLVPNEFVRDLDRSYHKLLNKVKKIEQKLHRRICFSCNKMIKTESNIRANVLGICETCRSQYHLDPEQAVKIME